MCGAVESNIRRLTHLLVLSHALLGLGELVALSLLRHGVFVMVRGHFGWLWRLGMRLMQLEDSKSYRWGKGVRLRC